MKFSSDLARAVKQELYDLQALANRPGRTFWAKKTTDSDYADFLTKHQAAEDGESNVFSTVQGAVDAVRDGAADTVLVCPGAWDETVTVAATDSDLLLIGLGGRGAAFIEPTTVGAEGMNVIGNDVTLINFGVAGEDDADYALNVFGARFRAYQCKFEGPTANVVRVGPDTVANGAASGVRTGADALFDDCEFCWGGTGIVITSSDYGPCTELYLRDPRFHDLTVAAIGENDAGVVGAGKGILIVRPLFQVGSDGSAPTDWIDFNSAGSTGLIVSPMFEDATLDSATVQLATGVRIVDWHTEQEGAPSLGGTNGRPD